MPNYDPIADSEIEIGKPITTALMLGLRDNPIAIAEAATGAPRIADDAADATVDTDVFASIIASTSAPGAYAFLGHNVEGLGLDLFGGSRLGSQLAPAGLLSHDLHAGDNVTMPGTWQCQGTCRPVDTLAAGATLWRRIL